MIDGREAQWLTVVAIPTTNRIPSAAIRWLLPYSDLRRRIDGVASLFLPLMRKRSQLRPRPLSLPW